MSEEHQKSLVNQGQTHDLPNDIIQHIFNRLDLKDIFSLISLNKAEKKFIEAFIWFVDTSKHWVGQIFSVQTTPQTRANFRQQFHVYLHGSVPKTIIFKNAILDTRYLVLTEQDWLSPYLNLKGAHFFLSSSGAINTACQPADHQCELPRTHLHNIIRLILSQQFIKEKITLSRFNKWLQRKAVSSSTSLNDNYVPYFIMLASLFHPLPAEIGKFIYFAGANYTKLWPSGIELRLFLKTTWKDGFFLPLMSVQGDSSDEIAIQDSPTLIKLKKSDGSSSFFISHIAPINIFSSTKEIKHNLLTNTNAALDKIDFHQNKLFVSPQENKFIYSEAKQFKDNPQLESILKNFGIKFYMSSDDFKRVSKRDLGDLNEENFYPLAFITATSPLFVAHHIVTHLSDYLFYADLEETLINLSAEIKQFFNLMSDLSSKKNENNPYDQSKKEILAAIDTALRFLNENKPLKEYLQSHAEEKSNCQIEFQKAMTNDELSTKEKIALFDNFSPRIELNRHRNPTFDRLFGIHNTTSWRNTWKTVRDHAKTKLFSEVNELEDKTQKLKLLEKAKQAPLFKTHRNNSFFQGAFGRTQAVIDIENKMAEINATTATQATV